jgi:hypothetical protein
MLSMGSSNLEGCNGVPYPTTPGAKADVGPAFNGTAPSSSFGCYSAPNELSSLCCAQVGGTPYDWCGWDACVVSDQAAWQACIERSGAGMAVSQKCVASGARSRRAGATVALLAVALGVLAVS